MPIMSHMSRKQFNLSVPTELADAFDKIADQWPVKKKWIVASAAVLMFLEATPQRVRQYVGRIGAADLQEAWEQLVREAQQTAAGVHTEKQITDADIIELDRPEGLPPVAPPAPEVQRESSPRKARNPKAKDQTR